MILKSQLSRVRGTSRFMVLLALLYLLTSGYFLLKHVMWRDELQLWLVASKSNSFADLYQNKQYEIRPFLWFLICWVLSRFSKNPEILKIFNFAVAIALTWTLLFSSRKHRLIKAGFLFGFLPLFGYGAISQEYFLGTLVFLLAITFIENKRRDILIFVFAGILANINVLFAIASIGIAGIPAFSVLNFVKQNKTVRHSGAYGLFVYVGLLVLSLLSMRPPEDFAFKSTSLNTDPKSIKLMVSAVSDAFFPFIPRNTIDGNLGVLFAYSIGAVALGALCLLIWCSFNKSLAVGISILTAMSLLLIWSGIGYASYWWHFGVLLVAYFGFSIMSMPEWAQANRLQRFNLVVLVIILLSQSLALFHGPRLGAISSQPYSMAKDTSSFLIENCKDDCTLLTNNEVSGTSISAYLGGLDIFQVNRGEFGSFTIWNSKFARDVTWNDLLLASNQFNNPIFVTTGMKNPPAQITIIKQFTGAVWEDEDFTISKPNLDD